MSIGQDAGEGTLTAARIFEMKGMKYTVLTFTDPQGSPFRQSTMLSIQYWQPMRSKSSSFNPAVASSVSTCSLVAIMYLSLCYVRFPRQFTPLRLKRKAPLTRRFSACGVPMRAFSQNIVADYGSLFCGVPMRAFSQNIVADYCQTREMKERFLFLFHERV